MPHSRAFLLVCAGIFFLVAVLYGRAMSHAFIDLDDQQFIVQNPLVREVTPANIAKAFSSFTLLLYIPLTVVSYQVNAFIGGTHPFWFHLTDVVLHAVNAMLVSGIAYVLLRKWPAAALAGTCFAVHPLIAETVLWASARKDLLSAFFALASVLCYLQYLSSRRRRWYGISLLLYILGLLAKVAIAPLILVFFLLDHLHGRVGKASLVEKIPHVVAAALLGIIGVYGARLFLAPLGFSMFMLLAGKATGHYLLQLAWPGNLSLLHWQQEPVSGTEPSTLVGLILLCVLWALFFFLVIRRSSRNFTVGLGFFLLMLLPTYSAAQKAGVLYYASDKYAYLPLVGVCLIVGYCVDLLIQKRPRWKLPVIVAVIVVAVAFGSVTTRYVSVWKNRETLYSSILERDPGNPIALMSMAYVRTEQGKAEEALALYRRALESDPHFGSAYIGAAALLIDLGRTPEALELFERMIPFIMERQVRGDAVFRQSLLWAAAELKAAKRFDAMLFLYDRLLAVGGDTNDVLAIAGTEYGKQGRLDDAINALERFTVLAPSDMSAWAFLAQLYNQAGRSDDFKRALERILELDPGNTDAKNYLQRLSSAE